MATYESDGRADAMLACFACLGDVSKRKVPAFYKAFREDLGWCDEELLVKAAQYVRRDLNELHGGTNLIGLVRKKVNEIAPSPVREGQASRGCKHCDDGVLWVDTIPNMVVPCPYCADGEAYDRMLGNDKRGAELRARRPDAAEILNECRRFVRAHGHRTGDDTWYPVDTDEPVVAKPVARKLPRCSRSPRGPT